MATYYVELNGGDIAPKTELVGGVITPSVSFSGAQIYPTSGGGGSATLQTKSVTYTPSTSQQTEQVTPDQGYDGLDKVNVTVDAVASGSVVVDNYTYNNSSPFSFNASTGKITSATLYQSTVLDATVTPGYVSSASKGELTVYLHKEQQLDTVGATTYTPSTTDQTIPAQKYLTGAQTIKGVTYSGLDAGNIKKDVVVKIGDSVDDDRILSVTGTYEGGGGGGSWTEQTIATSGAVSQALDEFVWYHFTGSLTSLTITLNTPSDPQYANYRFDFNSGNPAVTLSIPNTITMPTDFSVELLRKYQIDILGTTATVSKTWNRYRYSTTDGTLFYGKGAPPGSGGANWKTNASNGIRSLFALYESEIGGIDVIPWGSDTTSFPDYGTVIYPIPIPIDAVGLRVTIPNRRIGPSFWVFNATANMTRRSDPGWQSNADGVVTYAFTQGAYQYLLCNVDSGTLESSATLEFLTN